MPMSFIKYLTEVQSSAGSSTVFEQYIVEAYNALSAENTEDTDDFKKFPSIGQFDSKEHNKYAEIAYAIARGLPKNIGTLEHSGSKKADITQFWTDNKGTDGTPKCDCRTINGKVRFSIKNANGYVIATPQPGELNATFYSAMDKMKDPKSIAATKKFASTIISKISKIKPDKDSEIAPEILKYATEILKIAKDPEALKAYSKKDREFFEKCLLRDTELKNELTKQLSGFFHNNPDFAYGFVEEAITGRYKFGSPSIVATANYMLLFDDKDIKHCVKVEKLTKAVIAEHAKTVKFRFRWRHGTNTAAAIDGQSTIKPMNAERTKTFAGIISEETNRFYKKIESLNEASSLTDIMTKVYSAIRSMTINIISAIKKFAELGMSYLMSFFNITLDENDTMVYCTKTLKI